MLSSSETPRPLPPAKARRASAAHKISSSPPPAYGSPFTFPTRRHTRQDILGSPMATTFRMVGWDAVGEQALPAETPDDMTWVNEKSREELKELLLKADGIIRERENELGITSAVCKGLYQNNVTLKSKHEELLSRIPSSPAHSISSPANLCHQPPSLDDNANISASSSDSAIGLIDSPRPSFPKRHARKVSMAVADVSLLSDQNAELLDKLERLEKEATSADQAGRRELKRLEKEIAFLREELEKTHARSDELEEKVQGAVASEAWRRKKEREAKFRAMRNLAQDGQNMVRNFAPEGSRFGGPSQAFSFFPTTESPDPSRPESLSSSNDVNVDPQTSSLGSNEHSLIERLLLKVQELEETNTKILQQQADTANRLSLVQRDTAHMSRVYDCLSDQNSIELEFFPDCEEDHTEEKGEELGQAMRFVSLKRTLESDVYEGTRIVHPEFGSPTKTRKTVMGLFEAQETIADEQDNEPAPGDDHITSRLSVASSLWSEGSVREDDSTWSSGSIPGAASASRLSPLHFFSPAAHAPAELSPIGDRATLQSELGQSWADMQRRNDSAASDDVFHPNHHLRTSSLYDLSQMSVPPSPSPTSRAASRMSSYDLDYELANHTLTPGNMYQENDTSSANTPCTSTLLVPPNSLRLSVEPPTPEKRFNTDEVAPAVSCSPPPRSPRVKLISDALRSRANRWADRRLRRGYERDVPLESGDRASAEKTGSSAISMVIPKQLLNAVDSMIDGFDNVFLVDKKDAYNLTDVDHGDHFSGSLPMNPHGRYDKVPLRRRNAGLDMHSADSDDRTTDDAGNHNTDVQLHTGESPMKAAVDYESQGIMLKLWLWIQFGIVVFVFLYAMARRGPTIVLTDDNKKAVVRHR